MSDGTGGSHPPPEPPPPPPPPVVYEMRPIETGDSAGGVLAARPLSTQRRGNADPTADDQPPDETVLGHCDRCGRADAPLVSWRVHLAVPHAVTLRGICASCAGPGATSPE